MARKNPARKSAKRRSDYRERLSTRRWAVARAYCAAMGYKARKDDPVIAAIAKDCELAEATVKVYLSAGQDMGPAAIEKLEAKLAAKGATIEAHLEDESAKKGLREFGNPKRKEPKIPKQDREALATDRMQVVKDYCRAVGAPTDEQSMLKRLAADTGLKPVSIALMLSGCSYLSVDRLRRLREKLPAGKKVDLAMLGNDPRVTVEETVVKAPEAPTPAPPPAKGAEPAAQVVPIPKAPATALMAASGPAVMILGADGSIRLVPAVSYPCVISITAKGEASIHCPPAGTSFGKGNVMEADDGTGVISVAFHPDPAESPRP